MKAIAIYRDGSESAQVLRSDNKDSDNKDSDNKDSDNKESDNKESDNTTARQGEGSGALVEAAAVPTPLSA